MNNETKAAIGTPIAKDAKREGAFYVSTLGEWTEISTPQSVWPVGANVIFKATILKADPPASWESSPVLPSAHTSAQMSVEKYLKPHLHREIEFQYYVLDLGTETPSHTLKVRILP
ncbi:hypothetical protein [Pseudomonas frederiksbergensis]|uniref:hypothetical protein n=1 Tax=Pseudomonas frederiksbergensis TaxID=104087 RepID=UPI0012EC743F|nr:hypothetical protein [Pseudomonas frederiksbergensis]